MNKSDSIKELATALNLAQAEMSGAKKGSINPAFGQGSKYADLGSVIEAIKQPFADNGLSYSQFPIYKEGLVGVTTLLMHTSGEWVESELLLPLVKPTPQAGGSAITYARRYALQSIAGIPAEDDDGNAASGQQGNDKPVQQDDDKEWYNGFDQHKAKMIEDIAGGKTAEQIIKSLSNKYKLSKTVRASIQGLQQ